MRQQIDQFLDYLVSDKDCTANTTAAYRNDLTQFIHFLESYSTPDKEQITSWRDLDSNVLQNYLLYLKGREYASSTVARKFAAVKSFCQYLYNTGEVDSDPTTGLESPKVEKSLPRTIDPDEIERLLNAPAHNKSPKSLRDKALMETLYATGMRVTELVSLDVGDVDLKKKTVVCGANTRRSRVAPIYDKAVRALEVYLDRGRPQLLVDPDENALFLNHRGQRLTRQGLWLIIKRYVAEAGIKGSVTPHTLRHSFAAHMLDSGADLKEVQERLGHANLSTTQVYQQVSEEHAPELMVDGEATSAVGV